MTGASAAAGAAAANKPHPVLSQGLAQPREQLQTAADLPNLAPWTMCRQQQRTCSMRAAAAAGILTLRQLQQRWQQRYRSMPGMRLHMNDRRQTLSMLRFPQQQRSLCSGAGHGAFSLAARELRCSVECSDSGGEPSTASGKPGVAGRSAGSGGASSGFAMEATDRLHKNMEAEVRCLPLPPFWTEVFVAAGVGFAAWPSQ